MTEGYEEDATLNETSRHAPRCLALAPAATGDERHEVTCPGNANLTLETLISRVKVSEQSFPISVREVKVTSHGGGRQAFRRRCGIYYP